jgi:hypothetical protein
VWERLDEWQALDRMNMTKLWKSARMFRCRLEWETPDGVLGAVTGASLTSSGDAVAQCLQQIEGAK